MFKLLLVLLVSQVSLAASWKPEWDKVLKDEIAKYPTIVGWDASMLCPNYRTDKDKFWKYFFMAVVRAESSYKTTTRYVEPMGADKVTKKQIVSEGLFQVSYQDSVYHGCDFDWSKDKHLDPKDPSKTIFDPAKNIACGVKIFNKQLEKRKALFTEKPYYWAVLSTKRPGYKRMRKYFNANLGKWCQP